MGQLLTNRRALRHAALGVYAIAAATALGVPVHEPGFLFYVPVALFALATNAALGAVAGATASLFYVGAQLRAGETIGAAAAHAGLRMAAFAGIGAIIGWSAQSNQELLERLREHAQRDSLTGLLNLRAFEAAFAERLASGAPFALLLADVDDLKQVNDTLGHTKGNELLCRVAETLGHTLATEAFTARIGGDEFAVLARFDSGAETSSAAQRLETVLAQRGAPVSIGWAFAPDDGTDALTLFHVADKRLYESKVPERRRREPVLLKSVS